MRDFTSLSANKNFDVAVFPPSLYISQVVECVTDGILVGGQNLNEQDSGAYTGETSGGMLSEMGCQMGWDASWDGMCVRSRPHTSACTTSTSHVRRVSSCVCVCMCVCVCVRARAGKSK